jgi:2-oxoglutarate ferredoxin oxidoreductase subunit beta
VDVLKRAQGHRGASFVEIFQNCVVFNDAVFAEFTEKDVAPARQLLVEHGQPLVFGAQREKGLRLRSEGGAVALEVVDAGAAGVLVHDERNPMVAGLLAALEPPEFPMALGVLYCDPGPTYEASVFAQVDAARKAEGGPADVAELVRKGPTWVVGEGGRG